MSFKRIGSTNEFLQVPPGTFDGYDMAAVKEIAVENGYKTLKIKWNKTSSYDMFRKWVSELSKLGISIEEV